MEPKDFPKLIDTKALAKLLNVSESFITKHRTSISGGFRVGKRWLFNYDKIRVAILNGEQIIDTKED